MRETFYHVTVLSNFARGFDKYSKSYCKDGIPESTFSDRFFLLRQNELQIGIEKATRLLGKLGLAENRLIALETEVEPSELRPNTSNGRGHFIHSNRIKLSQVHDLQLQDETIFRLRPLEVEDAMAGSLRLLRQEFKPFVKIRPRAVSFLPVALACQAKCPFCFSKASVSNDQTPATPDWEKIELWLECAKKRYAERAVITGGGEPSLLPRKSLLRLISVSARLFEKVVLITNAHVLSASRDFEIPFYTLQARLAKGPVLEACCGTGRLTLPIARNGVDITGLDVSAPMLELGRRKAEAEQLRISWIEGDCRNVAASRKFALIFCATNAMQHLHDLDSINAFLMSSRNALLSGGTLILDVFNPNLSKLTRPKGMRTLRKLFLDAGGNEIRVEETSEYHAATQILSFTLFYIRQGTMMRSKRVNMRCFYPEELLAICRCNGLEITRRCGNYDESPFTDDSPKQILFCRAASKQD